MATLNNVLSLLSKNQRRGMIRVTMLSIIQSCLDVFSIAVIVPLFYDFGGSIDKSSNSLLFFTGFSWEITIAIVIVVFTIKNIINFWITDVQSSFTSNVSTELAGKLYQNFYKQPWTNYVLGNSAEHVRKIKTTPSDFAHYVLNGYIVLLTEGFTCLLTVGVIVAYDYRVMITLVLLCLPVAIVYYFIKRKVVGRIDHSFRELTPQSNVLLTQGVDSFMEARIYRKEDFFIKRFMQIRTLTSQQLANLKTATTLPSRLFEITAILCLAALISYAKVTNPDQSNLIAIIGLLLISMYRIVPSINRMLVSISQMDAYGYSVSELKNSFSAISELTERVETISFSDQITLENISFQYKESNWAIRQLNVSIKKGDFVIVEGPSGAGKTTLLHLLAGVINPREGKICIDGKPLTQNSERDYQQKIGFVPQSPIILQDSFAGNIAFGEEGEVDLKKLRRSLSICCLDGFVGLLPQGHATAVGENGMNLSGGQRQRLALCRALYRDPEILLLDEVTNQLDHDTKLKVLENLKRLSEAGTTIILATHDNVAKTYATKTISL